ncbi:hypothetical protein ACFLW3_01815 [Chloroflexota bacterium]
MGLILWITIGILAITVIVGIFMVWLVWNRKKKGTIQEINYRTLFIMGVVTSLIGLIGLIFSFIRDYSLVPTMFILIIGIGYLARGWSKRETWKKSE